MILLLKLLPSVFTGYNATEICCAMTTCYGAIIKPSSITKVQCTFSPRLAVTDRLLVCTTVPYEFGTLTISFNVFFEENKTQNLRFL